MTAGNNPVKRYLVQKVEGYNADASLVYLLCQVEYHDGQRGVIREQVANRRALEVEKPPRAGFHPDTSRKQVSK